MASNLMFVMSDVVEELTEATVLVYALNIWFEFHSIPILFKIRKLATLSLWSCLN